MKILRYLFLFLFIFIGSVHAAAYNWYFSQSTGNDSTGDGTDSLPWQTMSKVQSQITSTSSGDTVNIYLKRGDTWTFIPGNVNLITITSSDGVVNFNAYDSGDKPIIDGEVTDWSTASGNGAYNVFVVTRDDCSFQNLEIKRVYNVWQIGTTEGQTIDGTTIKYCYVHDVGSRLFSGGGFDAYEDADVNLTNTLIENNLFTQLCIWHRDGYVAEESYTAAIDSAKIWSENSTSHDNIYRYNIMYQVSGEGIQGTGWTVEYNIFMETFSVAIYVVGQHRTEQPTIVRYNLVMGTAGADYNQYNTDGRDWNGEGIAINDEGSDGNNTGLTYEIYGNTVIGCYTGIKIASQAGQTIPSAKIYNNTFIDNRSNAFLYSANLFTAGYYYNNAHIKYDTAGSGYHAVVPDASSTTSWTMSNNSFWGASNGTDAVFQTSQVTGDPKIHGEEDGSPLNWDGLTAWDDVSFADIVPDSDSSLIGAGYAHGYTTNLLTTGTDFSGYPESPVINLADQLTYGYIMGATLPGFTVYGVSPINNATEVAVAVVLSWSVPGTCDSLDVYFEKTDTTPDVLVSSGSLPTSYDPPGDLDINSDYYFQVDCVIDATPITGGIYHFTTTGGPPASPADFKVKKYSIYGKTTKYSVYGQILKSN